MLVNKINKLIYMNKLKNKPFKKNSEPQLAWKKFDEKDSFTLIFFDKDGTGYGYVWNKYPWKCARKFVLKCVE